MEGESSQLSEDLRTTPITARHKELGARMVPFAGWEMPVQYQGVIAEHNTVRTKAGLFDLCHMGQFSVTGPDALAFLQYTTTNDMSTLEPGQAKYTLLSNPDGGVIDDLIVYRNPAGEDGYVVCMNAANAAADVAWWNKQNAAREDLHVTLEDISPKTGMIAIQGPIAQSIVARLTETNLDDIEEFTWDNAVIAGVKTKTARTGYTGEDGFEFYSDRDEIATIWDALLQAGEEDGLIPVGLGARDTLRLEARMPLYGQELGMDISPYEASLGWAVKLKKGDFVGRDAMAAVKEAKPKRKAVGFKYLEKGGAPRTGYPVSVEGEEIGEVTSGTKSPTLGENIGLALISSEQAGVGREFDVIVRGKPVRAVQVKTPFYKRVS